MLRSSCAYIHQKLLALLQMDRADVGANMARLLKQKVLRLLFRRTTCSARSRIADVDVAQESANFASSADPGAIWNGHARSGQCVATIGS